MSRLQQLSQDLAGTARDQVLDFAGTSDDQTLGFGYTPASQIASNTHSNDAYAWTGHYNLNRGYTANGRNQYTAVASITPTYDTKGNLTSAGSTTYAYTSENLLTSTTGGIALAYDPAMRLYQTSGGSAGTTRFGYDGADLLAEYNSSNAMLRRYVHGPGADEPLVWYEGSGTTDRRFLHSDERGSVVAVTNSSGTTLNLNGYDEYGIPSSGNAGRFQYTGQAWLPELGMYYYKARIYSPTLGRFLQTDPIGYGDRMNMYGYVGGDPINATDPSGLTKEGRIACTGTRIANNCGGGGIANGLSGFSSAWPGGQAPTGESSLNALGVDTSGMSNSEMRALAGEFLYLGEQLAQSSLPRDAVVTWGIGSNGLSSEVTLAGIGHNEPPGLLRTILGRIGGVITLIFSLGGDTCKTCDGLTPQGIIDNPHLLTNRTLSEVQGYLKPDGTWRVTAGFQGAHKTEVWVYREWRGQGWSGRQIRWHPGGGHHGPHSYWLVNNGRFNVRVPSKGR